MKQTIDMTFIVRLVSDKSCGASYMAKAANFYAHTSTVFVAIG